MRRSTLFAIANDQMPRKRTMLKIRIKSLGEISAVDSKRPRGLTGLASSSMVSKKSSNPLECIMSHLIAEKTQVS